MNVYGKAFSFFCLFELDSNRHSDLNIAVR